ncbi:MAG: DUF4437 domain-containing protein [Verrucomicrobiales bacterium]|nr:DUF4437 domain-containing protein [Verrucomicrobiales bacterium]
MRRNALTRKFITAGLPLLVLAVLLTGRSHWLDAADPPESKTSEKMLLTSDVEWTPLNPARGDQGPKAGTLWGDRAGAPQTGFLVKFADGFSSPPHIHNVTYRGVVISGLVHNDDPEAEAMWMPSGSYWTQPAGEVHITAAKGAENIAYIEIQRGPYLVWPAEKASDNGERPINVHESNIVWLDTANSTWLTAKGPELAFLWGQPGTGESIGTLLKLPAGFSGEIRSDGSSLKAVVVEGAPQVKRTGESEATTLTPGSYFSSEEGSSQLVSSDPEAESILYIRTEGRFEVASAPAAN